LFFLSWFLCGVACGEVVFYREKLPHVEKPSCFLSWFLCGVACGEVVFYSEKPPHVEKPSCF
jgi:hypothetical protein